MTETKKDHTVSTMMIIFGWIFLVVAAFTPAKDNGWIACLLFLAIAMTLGNLGFYKYKNSFYVPPPPPIPATEPHYTETFHVRFSTHVDAFISVEIKYPPESETPTTAARLKVILQRILVEYFFRLPGPPAERYTVTDTVIYQYIELIKKEIGLPWVMFRTYDFRVPDLDLPRLDSKPSMPAEIDLP